MLGAKHFAFSADGSQVAYAARSKRTWRVVSADKEGPEFNWVDDPVYSRADRKFCYIAKKGKESFVVCGDEQRGPYTSVGALLPTDRGLAYSYAVGKVWKVMNNGREQGEFDAVDGLRSWPSAHLTFVGKSKKTATLFLDSTPVLEAREFDSVTVTDAGEVAYAFKNGDGWQVGVTAKGSAIHGPPFSKVGQVVAGVGGIVAYAVKQGKKWRVYIGRDEAPTEGSFDDLALLGFSDHRLIYLGRNGNEIVRKVIRVRE